MKNPRKRPELKPLFVERMKDLLSDEGDLKKYLEIINYEPVNSIRCNKIKISPEKLKTRLEEKYKWKISQPWKEYPEVMIIDSNLLPGELGRSIEHLLGYYYVQELSSMLPIIALNPKPHEKILDLCASPGSKTTQIASDIKNSGLIIANEKSIGRIKILASNLERCGVTNTIITRDDGISLCKNFKKQNIEFDKILLDAPCSGEGTLRSSIATYKMWNPNTIKQLSKLQKKLFSASFDILKKGGEILYSTCTHAPEEDEEIVKFALEEFKGKIKIEKISVELPKEIKIRPGIKKWKEETFPDEVKLSCRLYPQDNNTEGFFLVKFTKLSGGNE